MEKIKLNVRERESKTPNLLRREAKIPATLYGPGEPSQSVQIDEKEFTRLPSGAYSHMVELDFGSGKPANCVIRSVQRRAYTGKILNVELYRVRLDRKISVTVPLKFVGTSPAIIFGAQLVEGYLEADIECFPNDIPDFIDVDLTNLKQIDDAIHFSQLTVSDKIKILNPPDEVVAKAIAPRTQAEAAPEAAATSEGAPAASTAAADESSKPSA